MNSGAEPEPPGAEFLVVGAESPSRSQLFKAAPAPSYRKGKKKSLVLVLVMDSVQIIHIIMFQNRI